MIRLFEGCFQDRIPSLPSTVGNLPAEKLSTNRKVGPDHEKATLIKSYKQWPGKKECNMNGINYKLKNAMLDLHFFIYQMRSLK